MDKLRYTGRQWLEGCENGIDPESVAEYYGITWATSDTALRELAQFDADEAKSLWCAGECECEVDVDSLTAELIKVGDSLPAVR